MFSSLTQTKPVRIEYAPKIYKSTCKVVYIRDGIEKVWEGERTSTGSLFGDMTCVEGAAVIVWHDGGKKIFPLTNVCEVDEAGPEVVGEVVED